MFQQIGQNRSLIHNFSFRFFADSIIKVLQAVIGVLLANYLGGDEYGSYNLIYSIVFIVIVISEMGLGPIIMRDLAVVAEKEDRGAIIVNAVFIKLSTSILIFGGILGVTSIFGGTASFHSLLIIALVSLFFNWNNLIGAVFESEMQLFYPAMIQLTTNLLLIFSFLILLFLKGTLFQFILVRTVIGIPETILLFYFMRRTHFSLTFLSRQKMIHIIKQSFPLLLANLCGALYLRIDQLFLDFFHGLKAVGVYASAVNLVEPFWLFPIAFMTAAAPLLARMYAYHTEDFQRAFHVYFTIMNVLCWPLAVGSIVVGQSLIDLLYAPEFSNASMPFILLMFGNIFVFLGMVNNKLLVVSGKQIYDLVFTGSSLVVNIIFNIILIPGFGILGAAAASLLAYATGPVMGFFLAETSLYSRAMFKTALRPAFAATVMGGILLYLDLDISIMIGVGSIIYSILLLVMRGIGRSEFEFILSKHWINHEKQDL